jgi:hypothetical protein
MDNATSTLIAHNPKFKCEIVGREELGRFAPPVGTSTWRPVAHVELVDNIVDRLDRIGMDIVREQYAVGKGGLALFGTLDLMPRGMDPAAGRGIALGLRHSNDRRLPVHIVGGARVFVCDNLALSGEKIALRKHTRGLHLAQLIREGLDRFLDSFRRFNASVIEAEGHEIADDEAKVRLFDLRYQGVLPVSIFDEAATNYFRADALGYEDSAPRTVWGLHNACTRAVKALAPSSQFSTLTALGRAFGLGSSN